jgi:hypothetical protein
VPDLTLTVTVRPLDVGDEFTAGLVVGLLRGAGLHVLDVDLTRPSPPPPAMVDTDRQPGTVEPDLDAELDDVRRDALAIAEAERVELLRQLEAEQAAPPPDPWPPAEPIERRPFDPEAARARAAQGL